MRSSHHLMVSVAIAAVVMQPAPAIAQSDAEVEIQDSTFAPADVTIEVGGTVTWTQVGSLPHSVTADDGSFDSSPDCTGGSDCLGEGDTFTQTFDEPGEYAYYCRVHGAPGGVGMAGMVTVVDDDAESMEEPAVEAEVEISGSLTVADQAGDGTAVVVAEATISGADGWVVVHADDDGAPGAVLGHAAVEEGTTSELSVTLDEPLTADATVWPMLHVDAGEAGVYEFPGADGPVSVDGEVVVEPLEFTVEATADDGTDAAVEDDEGSLPMTGTPLAVLAVAGLVALMAGSVAVRRRTS